MSKKRLAIVTTHPIQYQAPWFRGLVAHPDIELQVYFCQDATPKEQAQAGFNVEFKWDVPILEGYPYKFLNNVAREPSIGRFTGLDVPQINGIIRQEQFDVVLVSGWNYKGAWQTFFACWHTGTPLMVRSDSHLHTQRSLLKKILKYPFYRWFLSRMDAALAVGQWSRQYFEYYGLPQDRVFLVPHVVDQERFLSEATRLSSERDALRLGWGIPLEAVVYLFCGKLNDKKRPLDFVQAVGLAHQQNSNIMGLIVGDGSLRQSCETLAQQKNIPIKFTGFINQTDLPHAYAASDMITLPSDGGETWGLVINEAMLSELPALVSDQVGCRQDLIELGQTGDIFPMGDVDQLTAQMVRYAKDPSSLRLMGKRARKLVLSKASVKHAVDGTFEAIHRILMEENKI